MRLLNGSVTVSSFVCHAVVSRPGRAKLYPSSEALSETFRSLQPLSELQPLGYNLRDALINE